MALITSVIVDSTQFPFSPYHAYYIALWTLHDLKDSMSLLIRSIGIGYQFSDCLSHLCSDDLIIKFMIDINT